MPCGCTKKASATKFIFTDPDGKDIVYTSEVQAKAAKIRAGGGTVKPA